MKAKGLRFLGAVVGVMLAGAAFAEPSVEITKACQNTVGNGNFTADTKSWAPAKIKSAPLNDDGTVTLTVPVSSASGFMILQSGDAKVVQ